MLIYSSLIFVSTLHNYKAFVQRTVSRMELEEQREVVGLLLRDFEQSTSDWLWQTDLEHRLDRISDRMVEVAGVTEADLDGRHLLKWLSSLTNSPDREEPAVIRLGEHFREQSAFRDLLVPVILNGAPRWWSLTGRPVFDRHGIVSGYHGVGSDVTSSEETQAQIAHMASHDSLTDLPNRMRFHDALGQAAATDPRFALLWMDLDQFKAVNDTLGHAVGDTLLAEVANRLRASVGAHDVVARLGGDEFAILLAGAEGQAAGDLANRIVATINEPYHLQDGVRVGVGVSIGIVLAPADGDGAEELLKNADLALYRAKADGRGTWRFYEAEMDARAQERRELQNDLRLALERGEFSLAFQPIVDLPTSRVATVEALLRWSHTERGAVPPDQFVPLAEETGLIVAIGEWVLRTACKEAAKWRTPTQLAVNVSPMQFRDPSLLETVEGALSDSGLPPELLELELTESIFLEANDTTVARLHKLRALGVSISLDDFGTGYSSLSYLRSFPFDKVKIDKSFVHGINHDRSSLAIVRAVIGMANSLGMTVVAEGVETEEQLILLRAQACSRVQGYLFSPPVTARQVDSYIQQSCILPAVPAPRPIGRAPGGGPMPVELPLSHIRRA